MSYQAYLHYKDIGDSETARESYDKSKMKGRFRDLISKKRRKELGPGRFWGPTSGTVFLNNTFIKVNNE